MKSLRCVSLIAVGLVLAPVLASAAELPVAKPEEVGMSSSKLAKVDDVLERFVKDNKIAGGIVMIARRGKVVHFKSYGKMDLEADKAMRNDAILRFYSMTKSITSAAALALVDEGKLELDTPVAKHLPELKGLRVHSDDGPVKAARGMTVRDLMRHTAGFSYGFGDDAVDRAYKDVNVLDRDTSLDEMVTKLGTLPLRYSPGEDWAYSLSIDALGRVCETVSGKSLDVLLKEKIFEPLDMKDTGFHVPESKLDRFAANYTSDGKGKLTLRNAPATSRYRKPPGLFSGGGGLVSTARDYMRFLVCVSQDGPLDGKRILSRDAVRLMTTNQLPKPVSWIKFAEVREGVGFGLGFSVRVKMSDWDPQGRVGEYGWGGAASTHYWVSPKDELAVITLEQVMPYSFMTEFAVKGLIYDAIEE